MRPAFSSTKQAAAFALLLVGILLLPVVLRGWLLPPSSENYLLQGWDTFGDYPYLYQQIFQEKEDIDLAFVGSSRVWFGIDAVYVQQKLSEQLGRPAVVRTIAYGWGGYDKLYMVMRDLLQHRRVRMLVFNDEGKSSNLMDPNAHRWFRFGENGADVAGFPMRLKADYYFASILGLPRNLLSLARSNLVCEMSAADIALREKSYFCTNPATRLGSTALLEGYGRSVVFPEDHLRFEAFSPAASAQPVDAVVYSAATKDKFQFSGPPMLVSQTHFAKKFAALATEKSAQLIMLHVPDIADAGLAAIPEREYWPDTLQTDVTMIGIPPPMFFAGLNHEQIFNLFADPFHLNQNGQKYFTRLITPTLLKIYEASTNR
jgi:hypothetical protein